MLADEYRQVSDISFMELEKIRKKMKNSLLVGGWAAYYLSNSRFKEWKKTDYMGSKDIDFGIRAEDLGSTARKLKNLGYTPVNFRFYKIFDRESKKLISIEASKKRPQFELFYLYVDLILDKQVKMKTTFFSDPLLEYCLNNALWIEKDNLKIIAPEPFVLMKLRVLKNRNHEKRIKDILDCFFVLNFSDFNLKFFQELREIYKLRNKENIAKIANSAQVSMELSGLRLDGDEIRNIKTSFLNILG